MVYRIGNASVLGYALVCKIDLSALVESYVLEECVSLDRVIDIRLCLFVKIYNLCIAAAFDVEDTIVIPTVFIITD